MVNIAENQRDAMPPAASTGSSVLKRNWSETLHWQWVSSGSPPAPREVQDEEQRMEEEPCEADSCRLRGDRLRLVVDNVEVQD